MYMQSWSQSVSLAVYYTSLVLAFKGTAWGFTHTLHAQTISWECGLLMALI